MKQKLLQLFSHSIWFLDTQNRFYFIVKRLKNSFSIYRNRINGKGCLPLAHSAMAWKLNFIGTSLVSLENLVQVIQEWIQWFYHLVGRLIGPVLWLIYQLYEPHLSWLLDKLYKLWRTCYCNLDKYILKFRQIQLAILTNIFCQL